MASINNKDKKVVCIFCHTENNATAIEHIVSESFGNKKYVMQKGTVCDECNGRFSNFENTALTNSVFMMERARFGIETKKGKTPKGKIDDLIITGDRNFRESYLTVKGLNEKNFRDFDPETQSGYLIVSSFDKSEVASSKLVLKIGLESIYKSQRSLFNKFDFKELTDFLTIKNNTDWPFLTSDWEMEKFSSVPRFGDKYHLNQNHCKLRFLEVNEKTLLFSFKYGAISIIVNLINRDLHWIGVILKEDKKATLYPEHFRNKLSKIR